MGVKSFVSLGFLTAAIPMFIPAAASAQEVLFLRGDVNADGIVSVSDGLAIRHFIFNQDPPPSCLATVDVNDDGHVNISDVIDLVQSFHGACGGGLTWGKLGIAMPYPEPGHDPTPDEENSECESYEVEPAKETSDVLRLGDVQGLAGEEIEIPVYLTNAVEVEAVQLVVKYDPSLLTIAGCFAEDMDFTGTFFESIASSRALWFFAVDPHPEDGLFTVGAITSIREEGYEIPVGVERLVFRIPAIVSADAPPGTSFLLEPTNGPDGKGVKPPLYMRNELTHLGEARFVATLPETIPGLFGVVEDVTFFRGDANGDERVDLSDAITLLGSLFQGAPPPWCNDPADADDNGKLELTDAIVILGQLFDGSTTIAMPYPDPGLDPTPDTFRSCRPRS